MAASYRKDPFKGTTQEPLTQIIFFTLWCSFFLNHSFTVLMQTKVKKKIVVLLDFCNISTNSCQIFLAFINLYLTKTIKTLIRVYICVCVCISTDTYRQ